MSQSGFSIGGPAPYGLLGQLSTEAAATRTRIATLTAQVSSGKRAQDFADLGGQGQQAVNLSSSVTAMQAWQSNITAANSGTDIALSAMDRILTIAKDFYSQLNQLNGLATTNVDLTAASARDALREIAGLLNTKDGNTYVFAGQDSANPPVPSGDNMLSSSFFTQIQAAVGGLVGAGAAATISSTLAIAGSNAAGTSPFSSYLSQPASALANARAAVETGDQRRQQFGFLASTNSDVTSTGSSTTGSYMRDVMRALATLGSLSSSQVSDPGFSSLIDDTRSSLNGAISAMGADVGAVGNTRNRLAQASDQTGSILTSVTGQVSNIEDVDMAATLSTLSQVQTQLQASYQMISGFQQLSLVKYLG